MPGSTPNPTLRDLLRQWNAEAEAAAATAQRRHYSRRASALRAWLEEPRRRELRPEGLWLIAMCVRAMERGQ